MEKLPARVKARLVRGEKKLSPAATAAWRDAATDVVALSSAETTSLVRALLGKDKDSFKSSKRDVVARDRPSVSVSEQTRKPEVLSETSSDAPPDASRGSDASSVASDASSLARHVSTVTVESFDDGEWETVSGKKDRGRKETLGAKARGDEASARRARGRRASAEDGGGGDVGNRRENNSGAASSENGSASSDERAAMAPASAPKPPKGWAAILTGRASSAQLTPSEAAALAAEEAAKEAAALKEQRAREEEEAAREAAAAEERQKARAAAAERRAAEAKAAAARAVAGAPAKLSSASKSPEEKPTLTHPAVTAAGSGSLPPSRTSSPKPSGPWASVVLGAGSPGLDASASAATDGWRSLVDGALDAESAPQVTVTLDGGGDWTLLSSSGKDKKPTETKPSKALSALETAPAMPVVRAAKKRETSAPAPEAAAPAAPAPSAPRPSWSGWAVKNPPPKVDLKAEMEAALVTRAASPAPEARSGGSAPGSPAPSRRAESDAAGADGGAAASSKKKAGKAKDVGPPPPADRSPKERAGGAQTDRVADRTRGERGSFSPPPPPTSPPLTLPGASRFPPRPFAAPPAPPRAPAPASLQPQLDAAIAGVPNADAFAKEKAARKALAVRLGAEMLETAHVKPDSRGAAALVAERRAVDSLIRAVHAQAQALFPSAAAEVFGSFPTNAWVPGASNVDVALALPDAVVATPHAKMEALEALASALRQHAWAAHVNVVPSALRPLIMVSTHTAHFQPGAGAGAGASKPADGSAAASPPLPPGPPPPGAASGPASPAGAAESRAPPNFELGTPLEVHISVKDRNHKGAATVKFLRQAESEYPALSSVLCVQKAWLARKGLRGVYKGGIGSYSLALLALHALQRKAHDDAEAAEAAKAAKAESDSDGLAETDAVPSTPGKKDKDPTRDAETLGASLLHFLEFYGQQVDLTKAAVVAHPLRPTGKAAKKAAAAASASESPEWGVVPVRVPGGGPPIAAVGAGGLTVSDPTQPGHNAGGGCFGIAGVQASFREQLAAIGSLPGDASLLGALVAPAANGRGFVV